MKFLHVRSAGFRSHTGLRAALLSSFESMRLLIHPSTDRLISRILPMIILMPSSCRNFQRRAFKAHKPASKELEPYVDPPFVLQFLLIFPQLVFKVSNARPIHAH